TLDSIPAAAPLPAPPPAMLNPADVAGTWDVKVMPMNKDTVLTTHEMTATGTKDGWSQKMSNGAKPAVRVLAVAGDSVVYETGPYASVLRKGQQVTVHSVARLQNGKLVGVAHAKYAKGD